jgi:hypothetical protein
MSGQQKCESAKYRKSDELDKKVFSQRERGERNGEGERDNE